MSEDRVKCVNEGCNVTILASTVLKYGGLCGGCSLKKDQAEQAEYIRKNRRKLNPYEGVTDAVEIIRIMHSPRKHDPLVEFAGPPLLANELYGVLDDVQKTRLSAIAADAMRQGDRDIAEEIGKSLATLTDHPLDSMLEAWLDRGHLWPSITFRKAGSRIRDRVVATMQGENADINLVLSALAWIGDSEVERLFREWEANPPLWRSRLHVGPALYAHVAGWELSESQRRKLFHDECLAISVVEPNDADPTISLVRKTTERCPWCETQLVHLVELDLRDPRFAFLECTGDVLPVLTCERCTCFTSHFFARIDDDGSARLHASNTRPEWLPEDLDESEIGPWHAMPVALKPRPAIQAADWCMSLPTSQVGGMPSWVQDTAYPSCPDCQRTMRFIAQLDNENFPFNEGIFYAFLCASCRTTATAYQQT